MWRSRGGAAQVPRRREGRREEGPPPPPAADAAPAASCWDAGSFSPCCSLSPSNAWNPPQALREADPRASPRPALRRTFIHSAFRTKVSGDFLAPLLPGPCREDPPKQQFLPLFCWRYYALLIYSFIHVLTQSKVTQCEAAG